MTVLNAIRIVLENHLNGAAGLPALAWPNVPYTRVENTPYIAVEFIPVLRRPAVAGPDPEQRYSGLLYLTILTPENRGAAAGMGYADTLLTRFPGNSSLTGATVNVSIQYSEAKLPLHDPPFYVIPVEVGWYAYA
jgi:hypothetical protein